MKKSFLMFIVSLFFIACSDSSSSNIITSSYDDTINEILVNGATISYYVSASGDDNNSGNAETSPYLSVQKAINTIISDSKSNLDIINDYIIVIDGETTDEPSTASSLAIAMINAENPIRITLTGKNGGKINASNSHKNVLYVTGDAFVIIDGGLELTGSKAGGLYINTGATVKLIDGKIRGNTSNYGAGIYMVRSTFIMTGGEITSNTNNSTGNGAGIYAQTLSRVFLSGTAKIYGNTNTEGNSNLYLKYYSSDMGILFINGELDSSANIGYSINSSAVRSDVYDAIFKTTTYSITSDDFNQVSLDNVVGNYEVLQLSLNDNNIVLVPDTSMTAISSEVLTAQVTPYLDGVRFTASTIQIVWAEVVSGAVVVDGSGTNFNTQAIIDAIKTIDLSSLPDGVESATISDDGTLSSDIITADTTEIVTITYKAKDGYLFSNGTNEKKIEITVNIVI